MGQEQESRHQSIAAQFQTKMANLVEAIRQKSEEIEHLQADSRDLEFRNHQLSGEVKKLRAELSKLRGSSKP
jgi:uncharacterized protein (DUF3084 family)